MKLWLKITLLCIIPVILTLGILGGVLAYQSSKTQIEKVTDASFQEYKNTKALLKTAFSKYPANDMTAVTQESMIAYILSEYTKGSFALIDHENGNKAIYNRTDYEFVPDSKWFDRQNSRTSAISGTPYLIQDIDNETVLIIGSEMTIYNKEYLLFSVFQVTDIYDSTSQMMKQYLFVSLLCSIFLTLVLCILIKSVLRPLNRLKEAAHYIQEGAYEKRVFVSEPDEVGIVGEAFNKMADTVQSQINNLEDLNERQRLLLGSLTHEIKTPMTSIIGYADTLLHVKLTKEQQQNALVHIREEGRRLERLSGKLLNLVGLHDNNAITLVSQPILPLLEQVKKSLRHRLDSKQLSLKIDTTDYEQKMDSDLMTELLINLIDNAIKASEQNSSIFLTCSPAEISVQDFGIGISKDDLTKITEPFYMADKSRSRKEGGAGLGLSLVRQIAALHGGTLKIISSPGAGTTVKVVFDNEI